MSKSDIQISLNDALDELWQKYGRNKHTTAFSGIDNGVDALRLKLPKSCLEALAGRFSYDGGDLLPEVENLYQKQGYLTHAQACDLRKWKTARHWKTFRDGNSDVCVQLRTSLAAMAAEQHLNHPDFAAWILTRMSGIGIATASPFLTAWNSNEFGIIDVRVWHALHTLTDAERFKEKTLQLNDFRLYILLLRRWRDLEGVSPRLIDKALWQFDKENPTTLYEEGMEGITFTDHQYIIRKEGILSREPIIKGTRTPVRAIVENSRLGYTPEKILEALPHISLEAIRDACSYYNHHTEEIEEHIERNRVPEHLIHPSVRSL